MKTFEVDLLDVISENFAKSDAKWELVKVGEDAQLSTVSHLVQFIQGNFFYISLIEFIINDKTFSYTVRITKEEPKVVEGVLMTGSLFMEICWAESENKFYLRKYLFTSCGPCSLYGKSADFLQSVFSCLVKITSSQ